MMQTHAIGKGLGMPTLHSCSRYCHPINASAGQLTVAPNTAIARSAEELTGTGHMMQIGVPMRIRMTLRMLWIICIRGACHTESGVLCKL
jgi:hypothetical protein